MGEEEESDAGSDEEPDLGAGVGEEEESDAGSDEEPDLGAGVGEEEESDTGSDEENESGTGSDEENELGVGTLPASEPGFTPTVFLRRAGSAPLTGSDVTSFSFRASPDRRSKSALHSANT